MDTAREKACAPGVGLIETGGIDGPPREAARQLGIGLCLAALYGVALGARGGPGSALQHGLGVPLALASVAIVAVPSLWVFLSLLDIPLQLSELALNTGRSLAGAGRVLAGLAPAAALYVVTSGPNAARLSAGAGLALAVTIGGGRFLGVLARSLEKTQVERHLAALLAMGVFALFSLLLVLRVWAGTLPLFLAGGA